MLLIAVSCTTRVGETYARALLAVGAAPRAIAAAGAQGAWATAHPEDALRDVDGLLLTGGEDVEPWRYGGGAPHPRTRCDPARDALEIALCAAALERDLPLLGICRGIQLWNVAAGGTLWQDLPSERPGGVRHLEPEAARDRRNLLHEVTVAPDAPWARVLAGPPLAVNSIHHQGVREVAPGLRVLATAPDGLVEALVDPGRRFALAVQWHPEELCAPSDDPRHRGLFSALCAAAYQPRSST